MNEKAEEISLRPDERVQKLLLSTPAHFVGEFDTPDLLISHAWPPLYSGRRRSYPGNGDPLHRTTLIVAFRTPRPPEPAPGVVVPNYEYAGEVIASTLSVLFGKRFDSHGAYEMSGRFGMPDFSTFATPCNPRLRYNDGRPRVDRAVPLNFSEISRIAKFFSEGNEDPRVDAFHSAARFYRRALMTVEVDPEGAYLNLITAGEIVSSRHHVAEEDALDHDAQATLDRIAKALPDGVKLARFLRGRLRGVKRRFVNAIEAMVDDSFFDRVEADTQWATFQKADFRTRIGAAYDLRSSFVHSGYSFGHWISPNSRGDEVQLGKPVVPDKEMAKVLADAPLFSGLERIIRYVLLTFATELGATVEASTDIEV